MTSLGDPKTGGITVIQYNWIENLRSNEKIWAYHKVLHETSKHGHLGDASFSLISQDERSLLVRYNPIKEDTLFVRPIKQFTGIHAKSIVSLDVADGGLGVSTSTDNKLNVWETQDGIVRRQLEGHVFDVYTCRLFPSGVVVLSGGADMQMKIWDAASGTCPVTLTGHTAAIMDTCIIDRGKNIISVSKDGSARLWNCAKAKCVAVLFEDSSVLNCCDIIQIENEISEPENNSSELDLEFGTEGKLLAVGSESGVVSFIEVKSRTLVYNKALGGPVLCMCWLPSSHLIVGLENGKVFSFHGKEINGGPVLLSHDSASGVLCVKPLADGFILGRKDGVCQFYRLSGSSPVQLTGPDCDPVYAVAADSKFVYTTCRDAVVRKYRILDMKLREL